MARLRQRPPQLCHRPAKSRHLLLSQFLMPPRSRRRLHSFCRSHRLLRPQLPCQASRLTPLRQRVPLCRRRVGQKIYDGRQLQLVDGADGLWPRGGDERQPSVAT